MVAGCRDRVIADAVSVGAGSGFERGFDDALTAAVAQRLRQRGDDVVEARPGDRDGLAQGVDLVLVLDQSQLGEHLRQFFVTGLGRLQIGLDLRAGEVDDTVDADIGLADQAHGDRSEVLRDDVVDDRGALCGDPRHRRHGLQIGTWTDPVFAVARIGEELLGVGSRAGTEVQGHVVAVLARFEDEHGIGFGIGLEAGEVDERRVRTEAVVGVIRTDLESTGGNDEAFAGEGRRYLGATGRGEAGGGEGLGIERGAIPTGGHEIAEGLGVRSM
jgi:hypothetical protein